MLMPMPMLLIGVLLLGAPGADRTAAARIPTVAGAMPGLELWRGAKIGMSIAEVRRLFPAARPPEAPMVLTGGEVDRLELTSVDLESRAATARFFFKGGGLVSVELSLPSLRPAATAENMSAAREIGERFTARYGRSYDCGDRSFGEIDAYGCKWLKSPLSIRLWYMDVAGQAPLFYVAYRQANDPGYNL